MRSLVPILLTFGLLIATSYQRAKDQDLKGPATTNSRPATTNSNNRTDCPDLDKFKNVKPTPADEIESVALEGGSTPCSGWVELRLRNRSVVTLGLTASSVAESDLVCQGLGCGRMLRMLSGPPLGRRLWPVWGYLLDCWWNHTRLQDCMKVTERGRQSDSLGIVCQGAHTYSRLDPSPGHCAGSLPVLYLGSGRGGGDRPTLAEADSLCQRLRCGRAVSVTVSAWKSDVTVLGELNCLLHREKCLGEEQLMKSSVYSITCREGFSPAFRLRDGESQCDGLVEAYYNGSWWPVCQDTWEKKKQDAVCSQAGCQEHSEFWNRAGSLGKNHTGSSGCVRCRQFPFLSETGGLLVWDIQVEHGSFQQLNVTCPRLGKPTDKPKVVSGSTGPVTAGILLLVLVLLLLALAWGWKRYRGNGVGVFRRKRTQRQWIGPTGATTHTVSVHRNNNASSRPVSAVSAGSHSYSVEPSRGFTAYPALERRSNMLRLGQDRSSDSDYDFFEPNMQPL
ncbi:scavenger receptor cysteine-rich type 1 protein M130-like [Mobula birostris]|uniref:scavenger receptor cysteine-rich type 1 protein M130-like n=1 Tax=Mobula birostris TaxID=1983395 RepID=UPI003B2835E0